MEFEPLNLNEKNAYINHVKNHSNGSIFQTLKWRDYQEKAFNRKSYIYIGREGNKILNSVMFFVHPLPFNKTYLYSPRGPLFCSNKKANNDLIKQVDNQAKKNGSILISTHIYFSLKDLTT